MTRRPATEILVFAKSFFYGTSLSRVTGMMRDMSLAYFFGSSPLIAAFMLAYRFAYLFRRLFGESSLQPTIIPHFETLRLESEKKSALFFRDLMASLSIVLVGICLFSQMLLRFHWTDDVGLQNVIQFSKILVIGLVFICLYALESAILMCQKKYFLPGFAPALFNLVWIAVIMLASLSQNLQLLAWGVVLALFVQWAIVSQKNIAFLKKHLSFKEWASPRLFSQEIRLLFKPISLVILGIGAMQINSALDGIFARIADVSGPAYLWYAIRFQQLPLALFGISIAAALLPSLSRAIQADRKVEYQDLLRSAVRSSSLLMLPATFALVSIGGCSLNLVYGRGGFNSLATLQTLYCLWGYAIAVFPMSIILLVLAGYYARKEYALPAKISLISILINVALNSLFIWGLHWGSFSVAIATSISSLFQCWMLCRLFQGVFTKDLWVFWGKIGLISAVSGCLSIIVGGYLFQDPTYGLLFKSHVGVFSRNFKDQVIHFSTLASVFAAIFLGGCYLLGVRNLFFKRD